MTLLRPALLLCALLLLPCADLATAFAECPGGGGPRPRPRPAPGPAVPTSPTTPPPTTGSTSGNPTRGRSPVRTAASIDSRTWEYWWGLNQSEYLPVLGYEKRDAAAEGYAPGRDRAREDAIDILLETLLRHGDSLTRTAAARALTVVAPSYRRADQEAALLRALKDPYREVREIAGLALGRRGASAAVTPLRKVLARKSEHRVTRAFAAMALIALEDEKGIKLAKRISTDAKDPDLAGAILIGFGGTGKTEYTSHLLAAVRRKGGSAQRRRRVQCDAMMALGKLGDEAAVPALVSALSNRERLIQRAAALALGGFPGNEEAARALVRRGLTAEDHLTRAFAVISLARMKVQAAYPRIGCLAATDRDVVKGFALLGLGIARCPSSTAVLAQPLATRQRYGEFGAAAIAAGLLGADRTKEVLASVIGKLREPRSEGYASIALGLLGADDAIERLRSNLWTDSATLQYGVPVGLAHIDARGTAQWLDTRLTSTKRDSARGPLVDAVSLMGGSPELQTLVSLWRTSPPLDVQRRLLYAYARILSDHVPGYPRTLCRHTYFPFNNDVLAHLLVFP